MRLRAAIVLLCLPAMLAACGDDAAHDELVRAADATRDAGGARFTGHGVMSPGYKSYRYRRRGIRDATGSTDTTFRYFVPGKDKFTSGGRSINIGATSYSRYPGGRPGGKTWVSIDWGGSRAAQSTLLSDPDPADPGAIARVVDSGDVEKNGRATVRGIPTTEYAVISELRSWERLAPSPEARAAVRQAYARAEQLGGTGTLQAQFWVDDRGLIRRLRQRLDLRLTGYDYPRDDQTLELFDFGLKNRVKAPPKRDTEIVGAEPE
jgi:hypothetical protein